MWKLALRNVLRHKARNGMTLAAITVGVAALILTGGFVHDIFRQLGEILIHSHSGHIQLSPSGYFERGGRSPEKYLIAAPEPLRSEIMAIPEVDDVMGRTSFAGLINNGRSDLPFVGEGVEPAREALLGSGMAIVEGRKLEEKDGYGMMIGQGLARDLRLKPGNWATLIINTPDGALNTVELEVVGIFQTFSKDFDAHAVRIPLAATRELQAMQGVNTLVVSLRDTSFTDQVAAVLRDRLAHAGLEVRTWQQLNEFYGQTVEMYKAQFGALRIIILLMVMLSVANTVNMSVFERIGEFGTMMALGNRSSSIGSLIVMENTLVGLAGSISGVVSGVLLALIISAIGIPMPPPPNSDLAYVARILLVPSVVTGAFAVGMVATVVAALLPAARVRRMPVADALRHNV